VVVALLFLHHQQAQFALERIEFRRGRIAQARQLDQQVARWMVRVTPLGMN